MSDVRDAVNVARREFVERGRSKAFLISTGLILVVLVAFMVVFAIIGDDDPQRQIGYTEDGRQVAEAAAELGPQLGIDVRIEPVGDQAAARQRLDPDDEEPLEVVVVGDDSVLVHERLPDDLEPLLVTASQTVTLTEVLAEVELTAEQQQLLTAPQLQVQATDPAEEIEEGPAIVIAALAMFALFGLLIFYGNFIAQGIVEEKASRVIEVLLSAVRPTAMLYGKIGGLAVLGIAQSLVIAGVGLVAAMLLLEVTIPTEAYATLAVALAWYLLGFVLYATVFAVGASLVSRQEDLGAVTFPPVLLIFVAYAAAQATLQNPDTTLSQVAGLVPFTAPLVQPLRIGAQVIELWEIPVAIALTLATIAVLVPVAARFYAGSVLRFGGRVKLSDAWKGASD